LVHEFVQNDGLACLVKVGCEADQNHQNYILRGTLLSLLPVLSFTRSINLILFLVKKTHKSPFDSIQFTFSIMTHVRICDSIVFASLPLSFGEHKKKRSVCLRPNNHNRFRFHSKYENRFVRLISYNRFTCRQTKSIQTNCFHTLICFFYLMFYCRLSMPIHKQTRLSFRTHLASIGKPSIDRHSAQLRIVTIG
jgi:hypothetical protein